MQTQTSQQQQQQQQQPGYFNLELGAAYDLDAVVELGVARHRKKVAAVLGWIQTCMGAVCILTEIAYLMLVTTSTPSGQSNMSLLGTGIWTGGVYVLTGVLGVLSARTVYNCSRVMAFMVMSIVCSNVAMIGIYLSIRALALTKNFMEYDHAQVELSRSCAAAVRAEYLQVVILVAQVAEGITAVVSATGCAAEDWPVAVTVANLHHLHSHNTRICHSPPLLQHRPTHA